LSPLQLSVKDTVCCELGIVTETEPAASVEAPFQPLKVGLLVRVQFRLLPKFDVDQVTVVATLTLTEPGLALTDTDGPTPAVLTLATPVSGSIATALSLLLVVNCNGWVVPLSVQVCADTEPTTMADPSIDNINLL